MRDSTDSLLERARQDQHDAVSEPTPRVRPRMAVPRAPGAEEIPAPRSPAQPGRVAFHIADEGPRLHFSTCRVAELDGRRECTAVPSRSIVIGEGNLRRGF